METIIGENNRREASAWWSVALVAIGLIVAAAVWLQYSFGERPTRTEMGAAMREGYAPIYDKLDAQEKTLDKIDEKLDRLEQRE